MTHLSVVLHYPKQVYAVDYRRLVELPRHSEVFFQLLLADGVQHSGVD